MRPTAEMQRLRSVGRIVAVASGALAGIALVRMSPPAAVYSVAVIATVAGAAGTHRSRWYVTPAFTTFLVFLLLLYAQPETAASRFNERLLETLLGVGLAYAYGLALPALRQRRHSSTDQPDRPPRSVGRSDVASTERPLVGPRACTAGTARTYCRPASAPDDDGPMSGKARQLHLK